MARPKRSESSEAVDVEQLPCLVVMSTPDGYVVGRALVPRAKVDWISPTHVRPYTETRPTDVRVPALKQGNIGGQVELKPARTVRGVPVATQVGVEVVFGEQLDAAARRAKVELAAQVKTLVRGRKTYWRHLCQTLMRRDAAGVDWPALRSTPHGQACDCGATEAKRVAA